MLLSFVDVSFAVHGDMKSRTGEAITFGRGVIMTKSTKQKLNKKSTTESEVVGASDYMPDAIWLLRFLEGQGYKAKKCILMQDNESAIKLIKYGEQSGGRRTRHIDIMYFFVGDRLEGEGMEVMYCPTESMLADYFTKPLQGALFRKLRRVIMGMDPVSVLDGIDFSALSSKERVDNPPKEDHRFGDGRSDKRSYANVLKGKATRKAALNNRKEERQTSGDYE